MYHLIWPIIISLSTYFFFPSEMAPLNGTNAKITSVDQYLKDDMTSLLAFYKERHMYPEISLQEDETSKALATALRDAGYIVTEHVGGYGIVAILKNGSGPQILYRTDMDALPMYEKTELPYTSLLETTYNGQKVGTMHSCGHDIHMTTLLGTARAMAASKDQWTGTLMLIGQPAEEIGAGAIAMLDDGLYEKFGVPDYGIGLHCAPNIKAGQIGISDGYTMANAESIDIKVKGIGAHGASPHMSVDPIVLASLIVMEIQTIVSRNIKPIENAVITVGAIKGGTKHNIISDEVTLQLTVRTYKEEVRLLIHKRLKEICRGIAISAGLPEDLMPEVTIPKKFTPSNYNNPTLTTSIISSASNVLGSDNVRFAEPLMLAEDFAQYGNTKHKVPTVLYWLGTVTQEKIDSGHLPGLHSPFYYPDPETTISTGIKVNTRTMLDLMGG